MSSRFLLLFLFCSLVSVKRSRRRSEADTRLFASCTRRCLRDQSSKSSEISSFIEFVLTLSLSPSCPCSLPLDLVSDPFLFSSSLSLSPSVLKRFRPLRHREPRFLRQRTSASLAFPSPPPLPFPLLSPPLSSFAHSSSSIFIFQVAKKLAIFRPPPTLIDAYLDEIARTYGVKWRATVVVEGEVPGVLDASGEGEEDKKVRISLEPVSVLMR